MPVDRIQTETGSMAVATPETTAFDLVRFAPAAGHWSNVATVLSELAEKIDGEVLAEVAPLVQLPDAQRLGYLLTLVGAGRRAAPLAGWLAQRRTTIVRLRTDVPACDVDVDPRWRLIPNEEVDVEA
jgi:hypothetical protein